MSRSHIARGRPGCDPRLLACMFIAALGMSSLQVQAAGLTPDMQYAPQVHFSSADNQHFDLVAPGGPLGDDCDPLPLAASSSTDTRGSLPIVVASAESDETKPVRSRRSAKPDTMIDAVPMAQEAPEASVAAGDARDWDIVVTDKTLNATMARWAASAGWQLLWELPVDYAVEARTRVHGTFEEAVSMVANSMQSAEIPMKAVFYQGNRVLRIMAKGSE